MDVEVGLCYWQRVTAEGRAAIFTGERSQRAGGGGGQALPNVDPEWREKDRQTLSIELLNY